MSFPLPANMPALSLSVPTERHAAGNVELNEELLHHWIRRLPAANPLEFSARYLDALKRFNANEVSQVQRIKLLDMYRGPLHKLLMTLTIPKLQQQIKNADKRLKLIDELSEVINQLAHGYKIIVVEANQESNNLKLKPLVHMAIYRALDAMSLLALHCYNFYRTLPPRLFQEMHQLLMLTMTADIADKPVFVNSQYKADFSVQQRYVQIMLTSICNPYGLASGEVLRCYQLMLQLAPAAVLDLLPDNASPEAGQFYINCLSDRTPAPSVLPALDNNYRPTTLMLDTKPILTRVDKLFDQAAAQGEHHPAAENIRLLRQVVPYLNTSYQRKQPRVPVEGNIEAYVAVGLEAIHHSVTSPVSLPVSGDPWLDRSWEVLNKNSYGYLLQKRKIRQAHDLKIGDFVGILEQAPNQTKPSLKLASVRWLRTDDFEQSKMGLKFIQGDAIPVFFSVADSEERQPAFLIRENTLQQQPAMLITTYGIHATASELTIKTGKKRFNFTVRPDRLLTQNESFECFTFKDIVN